MINYINKLLQEEKIYCYAPIRLQDCKIVNPYLLEKENITDGTAFILAVPYYTEFCQKERNISAYAVSCDYHSYFKNLFSTLLPKLREKFPKQRFVGYSDHSPIAEADAAAKAGLGIIGDNHMLISEKYSSYVFLGEIITDMVMDIKTNEIKSCGSCGICMSKCPYNNNECSECLSAITQKKGELSKDEKSLILKYGYAWGCDICQEVCPHTLSAIKSGSIYTPIDFFRQNAISKVSKNIIEKMSEEEFALRAFSWRGRRTLLRNLSLFENSEGTDNEQ